MQFNQNLVKVIKINNINTPGNHAVRLTIYIHSFAGSYMIIYIFLKFDFTNLSLYIYIVYIQIFDSMILCLDP